MDTPSLLRLFHWLTLFGWLGAVLAAAIIRGRQFATMVTIMGGVYSLIALGIAPIVSGVAGGASALIAFMCFHVTVYVSFAMLARPRMRGLFYRLIVSWPGSFFMAGTILAMPWAIIAAFGFHPRFVWFPYAIALVGLVQSLVTREEEIDVVIGDANADDAKLPAPHPRGKAREARPLRIVQITDPHIGPFMSVARLRKIAANAVAKNPDLIFLTGDFLTMESQKDPELLRRAMEPLQAMKGRVFACHGNHDHEAPDTVKNALTANSIELLVDEERIVKTDAGEVQILGMDFTWRERAEHLQRVCAKYPRKQGATRIILLHDPGAFRHLPDGEGDLVLSGHTHGGQVGLVSLGLSWTFLRLFGKKIPDHGFWARGKDRLYVHRGTGHYGFPLRLGVPSEESLLRVHRVSAS